MDIALRHFGPKHGTPIVLLPGFPMDSRIWDSMIAAMPADLRVVTVDLFGFGNSVQNEPCSIAAGAANLHAALRREGLLPCVLGGLSMGGYVALSFAAQFEADLAGLMLIDTKAAADDETGKRGRNEKIELVRRMGVAAIVAEMLPNLLAASTLENNPSVTAALKHIMEGSPPSATEFALAAMRDRADHTETLSHLKIPTLILVGDQDRITPVSVATAMHQKIQSSTLEIIPDAGHLAAVEQPKKMATAIALFFAKTARGGVG